MNRQREKNAVPMKKGLAALCMLLGVGLFVHPQSSLAAAPDGGTEADGGADSPPAPTPAPTPTPPPAAPKASPTPRAPETPTPDAAPGSTGAKTPAALRTHDVLYLPERCIRTHEEFQINIDHLSGKALKVTKVYLVYPESIDKDHQERQDENPPGCGETPLARSGERSACVDLTNYISLNAGKSVIHIDLRRARLEERHAAPSTQEAAAGKREKERSLWAWNYALLGDRHASLLITYELLEGSATAGEERTVTLHPDIANRIRGAFWGVIGLLLSLSLTILIGFFVPIQQQGGPSSSRRADESGRWHQVLFAITRTPDRRYSISALQMLIWTCIATYSISYVWSMTGAVVQITPQMLALLGIGGLTAVLARFSAATSSSIPKDYLRLLTADRRPQLADFITSGDAPSIYKFQMLIFTILSAGIVAWEVTRAYVFPELPNELVLLMGISNGTYVLGSASSKADYRDLLKKIKETVNAVDDMIAEHNATAAAGDTWTSARVVDAYLNRSPGAAALDKKLEAQLQKLQEQLHRYIAAEGADGAEASESPTEKDADKKTPPTT